MKKNLFLVGLLLFAISCASVERTAYITIGSISVTVDEGMQAWGQWVRDGKSKPEQEVVVRGAYETYQEAMRVTRKAVVAWKTSPVDKAPLDRAVSALSQSAGAVIGFIKSFFPPDKAATLKTP